jgi:hypothetical protein
LLTACQCGVRTDPTFGEAAWVPDEGLVSSQDEAFIDFGDVPFGDARRRTARIENRGRGSLRLFALPSSGVFARATLDATPQSGARAEWVVDFLPVPDGGSESLDFEEAVTIETTGTRDAQRMTLHLRGRGYSPQCALPAELDFGTVLIGDTAFREVELTNSSGAAISVELEQPLDADGQIFSWEAAQVDVPARSSGRGQLRFHPTEERAYSAIVRGRIGALCPFSSIRVRGRGAAQLLTWEPRDVDCGWVPLGETKRVSLTFLNSAATGVSVTSFMPLGSAEAPTQPLIVPASGSATTFVACRPQALGSETGQVQFVTSLASTPQGMVPLRMKGGGPRIEVQPVPLSFGRVPWHADGGQTTRRLYIRNAGALPADAGTDGNLHLLSATGVDFVGVDDGGIAAADVVVSMLGYDAQRGLAPGERATVDVHLFAPTTGALSFSLAVPSDDGLRPVVEVPVNAYAVATPPCSLSVTPAALQFELLADGESRDLGLLVQNDGVAADAVCFLAGVDVEVLSAAQGFELVGGRIDSLELQPAAAVGLTLRAHGLATPGLKLGQLQFEVSDSSQPQRSVRLSSFSSPQCAIIQPDPLDFGLVPIGCSRTRVATVYNICAGDQSVLGASINGGGFAVDAGLGTFGTAQSTNIAVTFTPSDSGVVDALLSVQLQNAVRLVDVAAEGVPAQQRTESFRQPAIRQLDLMLAVSNQGTVEFGDGGLRADLIDDARAGLGALVARLNDGGLDLHVGVVSAEWDRALGEINTVPWEMGGLIHFADGGVNVLTSSSSSLATDVAALALEAVSHPSQGSTAGDTAYFEAILRALSPPLNTSSNAGFRRSGVELGVVSFALWGDFSTHYRVDPPWYSYPAPVGIALPTSYYWGRISSAAGGPSLVTMNAVATLPGLPDCPEPHIEDPGSRFRDMAQLSGGVAVDACGPWSAAVDSLEQSVTAFNRRFILRGTPDVSAPIVVRVDGSPLAPTQWAYDQQQGAVTLALPPPAGATIDVTYIPSCG